MLNISRTSVHKEIHLPDYQSGKMVLDKSYFKYFNRLAILFLLMLVVILFLPWTQSVKGNGYVTTINPSQRPQTIQSPIPGKIEEWYIMEGDYVSKGDTLLRISEIKSEYFDDQLLERTGDQIESKSLSADAYFSKTASLKNQMNALTSEQALKLQQAQNKLYQAKLKVTSDSMDYQAMLTNKQVAETQYDRAVTLKEEGLKATKDVEEKLLQLQSASAKLVSQLNKLQESRNELINADLELSRIRAMYAEKLAKVESELFGTQSAQFSTEAEVSKLENNLANYTKRTSLQYVIAPQDGYINKAIKGGLGEAFKEGESLINIMPANYDLAVETYVRPMDLPLMNIGERVRVQFDGWPAIVFSGWESISYGTYGAKIVAVERVISDNGKYRILLAPDTDDHEWPDGIRVGSGAHTIALLNDVPIWYEIWRQLNGFPPDFYTPVSNSKEKGSDENLIKSLK